MNATITWSIKTLECLSQADGQTDVVFRATWMCYGTQPAGESTIAGNIMGIAEFTYTQGELFTPYDQLTEQQVLGWVWGTFKEGGKDEIEAGVQAQINNQIAPKIVTPPLPWATPAA